MKKTLFAIMFMLISCCLFATEKTESREIFPLLKTRTVKHPEIISRQFIVPWTVDFELSCGTYYDAHYTPGANATMEQIFADLDAWANYFQMLYCGTPGNPTWTNL
jgi:hypothetical protein